MVTNKEVLWSENAEKQLEEIYNYIKEDSVQNAENVKDKIFASTLQLPINPEKYSKDKYRKMNNGSYRAYEIFRYRISYYISEQEIVIVRIRSTDMKPINY